MAQKVTVRLVDDLDGTPTAETIDFELDGISYAIDLSPNNATGLRDTLAAYVAHARRTSGRHHPTTPSAPPATNKKRNQDIREWAREHGMRVSGRGRIPAGITHAYDQAR
ncbi:histone-like nucleoid-structuring protein Lsr2 [Saccharopolyspora phatthalungensis]|uniref:Nucleoid-associated protein Lsr2 n=1 Tax=Saccharopolyspora phatthalungensis TaxID=664693 RepID=A0A840QFS0_9PSEU|nr:Lsr2 family protein [Saccharopolyspora phatthalungensis]MBB5157449.1 hypothetical protein [Saccharopolyspora phatthalungensis]